MQIDLWEDPIPQEICVPSKDLVQQIVTLANQPQSPTKARIKPNTIGAIAAACALLVGVAFGSRAMLSMWGETALPPTQENAIDQEQGVALYQTQEVPSSIVALDDKGEAQPIVAWVEQSDVVVYGEFTEQGFLVLETLKGTCKELIPIVTEQRSKAILLLVRKDETLQFANEPCIFILQGDDYVAYSQNMEIMQEVLPQSWIDIRNACK